MVAIVQKNSYRLSRFIFFHVEENEPKGRIQASCRRYRPGRRKLTPLSAGFKQVRAPLFSARDKGD
jgi:hypothetical protein